MVPVHNIFRTSRKWGSSYKGGILLLLLIIDLRPARTVEKDYNSSEHYDPYRINFQRNSNSQNKSDSIRSNDWKPVLYNETGYRRIYLKRVNVFESQKISNKTDLVQKSTGNKQDDNKKLPDLFRTLRLANHKELENFSDDNDDNSRQKKRYRHSKRVRVIKPPHFLVPPQKDEQPIAPDNEARQFYKVYQTQYTKTPGYKSSEESSRESNWKTEDDKRDSTRRNPRTKKIRRKPINYLRPPVITLTTTEHIFFIKPKETTPMSFIDNHPPSNNEEMNRTTERNILSEGPTSSSGENNITKPIKYRVMYPTTTEMNFIDETSQNSYPVYNTSDVFYSSFTPKTYNFANSPVTVYSMNDIFGLGDVPSNDFSIKSVKSVMNESSTSIYDNSKFMESNNSGRDGRYYNEQKSIESGGVYVVDPPNSSKDKEDFWSTDNFGKQSYRGSGTASSPYQGIEISTINYKNLETTSGDLSALNTGGTFGSSENSTSYGGSSTIANYRGSEKYGGPEMTTKFENLEATLRGSGTNYRGEDMRTSHRGSVSSTNYGGPVSSTISYRDREISTNFRDPVSSTTSYRDKEIRTNYRGRESSLRYGGPETSTGYRSTGTTPAYKYPSPTTSTLIYSDEVWKTSSYIPDDSRSSFYITNSYKPTENKPSTLSDIQSGILIHEINDMIPNTTVSINENLGEVLEHTESYFESTKMDRNLMSPEVQKTGMTISKLGDSNPVLNKSGDGLHQWIARFNPEEGGFRSSGRSKYGVDNSLDYQDSNFINPADRQVKLHVAESSHFRKEQTVEKALLLQQNNVIPGEAGSDYPILSKPPHNSRFICKADGLRYVADVSSGCQVFYMCVGEGPGEPMLCPNGTLFSQDFLVCDWWYNVECRYKK